MLKTLLIYLIILSGECLFSQTARLDGQFFEYSAYYVSSIDIKTGTSQAPLFRYRITSDQYPLYLQIWFRASMVSPTLGIKERATIIELESNTFKVEADIILDNRSFSSATTFLYDQASPPNVVPIQISVKEILNASQFESMLSAVMATGQLADGEYTFELNLYSGPTKTDLSLSDQESKTIIVQIPSGINLESPGGDVADTLFNVVYTTYPVFNWFTTGCSGCETYIRVAYFNPGEQGTPEDALRDETVLPFDQVLGWARIEELSTYQYPISGAKPLEYGKVYVWQIKNVILTTAGKEDLPSPIYAFKVVNPGLSADLGGVNPLLQALRSAIGEDQYNALFGSGSPLSGFSSTGTFSVNGTSVDEASVRHIFDQLADKKYSVSSVMVKD